MLLAQCLILASTVLQAQLLLYQMEPFQFVDLGSTAQILCMSTDTIPDGIYYSWLKRRENEVPVLVKECGQNDSKKNSLTVRFICRAEQQRLSLEISNAETEDSGVYSCASNYPQLSYSNGSSLIVGDSYTPSTQVLILLPPPPLVQVGQMACVVHGVSNLVQVSWEVPWGLQQEGLTLMVRNSSGLLTFVSVLQIPTNTQWGGKNFTCEVRFNSSGTRVKEIAVFPAALSTDSDGNCLSSLVPTVVVGLLALLTLLLTFLWIRFYPSRHGFQLKVDEAPSSEVLEEDVCYAHLDLSSESRGRNKKRKEGRPGENQKF